MSEEEVKGTVALTISEYIRMELAKIDPECYGVSHGSTGSVLKDAIKKLMENDTILLGLIQTTRASIEGFAQSLRWNR